MIQISNNIKLHLTFEQQTSPNGRPIRLSGIAKNLQLPEKFINKSFKNHWIYTFRFLDKDDEFISFEFDYNDNFTKVIKDGKR
jgi:hypothetical protein